MEETSPEDFISRGLKNRIRLFGAIAIIIVFFIARDVWIGDISWWLAAIALLIGTGVGTLLGRLLTITWHETEEKAVSEMDIGGALALAGYIVFELSRNWIFGHFLAGAALSAFTLAVLSGAIFGRALGMRISIFRLLRERKLIPETR